MMMTAVNSRYNISNNSSTSNSNSNSSCVVVVKIIYYLILNDIDVCLMMKKGSVNLTAKWQLGK